MFGGCLEGQDWTCLAQFEPGRYWVVSEYFLDTMEGVWKLHLRCLESTSKVSGRCLEDPDWTDLAQFGPGRYWKVSECYVDIIGCLESTSKVSGKYM